MLHIIQLLFKVLIFHFSKSLLLLVALDPRTESHLNNGHPDYIAAIVYVALELIDKVKHPSVISGGVLLVLLNELDLTLKGFDLDVIHLFFEFFLSLLFLSSDL